MACKRDNSHFVHYVLISFDVRGLPFGQPFFKVIGYLYYAPRRISGEHIVAASSVRPCVRASVRPYVRVSVRPCVRPALVHANSRKLLVGFQ